jgi:hypothetical protein
MAAWARISARLILRRHRDGYAATKKRPGAAHSAPTFAGLAPKLKALLIHFFWTKYFK